MEWEGKRRVTCATDDECISTVATPIERWQESQRKQPKRTNWTGSCKNSTQRFGLKRNVGEIVVGLQDGGAGVLVVGARRVEVWKEQWKEHWTDDDQKW